MKRLVDRRFVGLLIATLLVSLPLAAKSQEKKAKKQDQQNQHRLTLNIEGVECANCAKVISKALEGTDLKVADAIKPNTAGASRVVATCSDDCDLGAVAAQVNQAQTPHRDKVKPSLTLLLFADLDAKAASTALATCRKIEGVDGTACHADAGTGEIQLKISGEKAVTAEKILAAMQDAGIKARTTTQEDGQPQKKKKST
jgi:copper chaperone CopZ